MLRKRGILSAGLVILFAVASVSGALAVSETPQPATNGHALVYVFLPWDGSLDDNSSYMTTELVDQGYEHNPDLHHLSDDDQDDTDCYTSVTTFRSILMCGASLWLSSHGIYNSVDIEVYPDEDTASARLDWLLDNTELTRSQIDVGETGHGHYAIFAWDTGIAAWSVNKKQIYYITACYSAGDDEHAYGLMDDFDGGLELGYYGTCTDADDEVNAPILFQNMSGRKNDGTKRRSADALAVGGYTGNFRHSGSIEDDMVLAPAVVDWFPKNYTCDCAEGYVEFDCTMDTDAERTEGVVYGEGCVNVGDIEWENDHKVTFALTEGEGAGGLLIRVNAQKAVSANNLDIQLDGNMLPSPPYSTNGVAPNEDNFQWTVSCDRPDPITVHITDVPPHGCLWSHNCTELNNPWVCAWQAEESRWYGGGGCIEVKVYWDDTESEWVCDGIVTGACTFKFTNPAAESNCPPRTGWTTSTGDCAGGSMTIDY